MKELSEVIDRDYGNIYRWIDRPQPVQGPAKPAHYLGEDLLDWLEGKGMYHAAEVFYEAVQKRRFKLAKLPT